MKKNNKKGFTLAELLIVVAIIAVLTAIAIPVFTSQLEKSKEATDMANIRSAYAEVMAAGLTDTGKTADPTVKAQGVTRSGNPGTFSWTKTVTLKQSQEGWQGPADELGGSVISTLNPKAGGTCTITYTEGTANATIVFST